MIKKLLGSVFVFAPFISSASFASANHSWGNYHWARQSNPFTLKLGDNFNAAWDPFLVTTSINWSLSDVLDTTLVAGKSNPKNCRPTSGQVEVCNSKYGKNGWLGIAQVWVSGSHITQAITKMNDTYFNTSFYNTPAWKNLVVCQEVGHTLGLDHQDEVFDNPNLGTCMDYSNDPLTNQFPNQHDYDQLELIYSYLDLVNTVGQTLGQSVFAKEIAAAVLDNPKEWGKLVKGNNRVAVYERDFGLGQKVFTFVIWAN